MSRILIVDDDPSIRKVLIAYLEQADFSVTAAPDANAALQMFAEQDIALVIVDLRLGEGMDGLELIQEFKTRRSYVPIIMITAYGTTSVAVQAMKEGAYDFITKPFDFAALLKTVKNALFDVQPGKVAGTRCETPDSSLYFGSLVGESAEMQRIYTLIEKVAPTDASVLIEGESGTGKELVARAMHQNSKRNEGPWVPINCGAIPAQLLESELFGHASGAFTGADNSRKGLFQTAHDGTLFLDEIGVMEHGLQRKLLRVLQEGQVRPLGQNEDIEIDVRVIAATNEDIEAKLCTGEFREDLYYRLNVIPVKMPALRHRKQDIPLLARYFCAQINREMEHEVQISDVAMEALKAYGWPGNIRELQNAVACAATLCSGNIIHVSDLPPHIARVMEATENNNIEPAGETMEEIRKKKPLRQFLKEREQDYMAAVLRETGGNRVRAADLLGISRATLYRKFPE
ncbi:MAG: sigma-54-dependent transcriptional regulator [Verrucomicrobiota bacterium]